MRAWRTHAYGQPREALQLDDVAVPDPGPGEVRVRVQAIPLNLNDLERITGGNMMVRPDLPYSPGMEVMGVVDACGDGAEAWAETRVVAITKGAHGGFAEYAICPATSTFDMPADVPLPDAAALLFPFHLAWLGLFDRAQLTKGESVLVHAGAGGSGSAAIQLAADAGAYVFATASNDEKRALCRELGAKVAIDYTTVDFAEVILDETNGRGVDVVFDNVGSSVFDRSMHCIAYNGRYLMMGFASDKSIADEAFVVPRRLAMANVKLCGVLLAYADEEMSQLVKGAMGWNFASEELGRSIMTRILGLYRDERVRAVVGDVVDFAQIPAAVEALAARRTTGRVIVTV